MVDTECPTHLELRQRKNMVKEKMGMGREGWEIDKLKGRRKGKSNEERGRYWRRR